jgi:hypothetical protein
MPSTSVAFAANQAYRELEEQECPHRRKNRSLEERRVPPGVGLHAPIFLPPDR